MDKIIKKLELLGISGKEADIYIELLKEREATVVRLSKNTGIKRTSVYYSLEALMKKGVVGLANKNNKKLYFAENPKESLNSLIESQKEAVHDLLPYIRNISGKGSDLPAIKTYYNLEGLKKIFDDVLTCKEKIARYYVSDLDIDNMLGEAFLKSFIRKRISLGIKSLSLRTSDYAPERESANQLRESRIVPKELAIAPYMCFYDNKSVIISSKDKFGFIIESQGFADAQKSIFDTIWNMSRVIPLKNPTSDQSSQKATEEDIYY